MGLSLCATGANADAPSAGVTMSWGQVCPCPSVNERWDLFWVIRWDLYWNSGFHATDDRFCATTVGLCTKKRCTSLIGKTYPLQTLSFVPRGAGVRWVKMMHFAFKTRNFVLKTRNFAFYTRNCALKTRNCALKMMYFAGAVRASRYTNLQLMMMNFAINDEEFCITSRYKWWILY